MKRLRGALTSLVFAWVACGCASDSKPESKLPKPDAMEMPTLSLQDSGPIQATGDGEIIEELRIASDSHSECAIEISGRKNVTVLNVDIRHAGAGICIFDSENITIENVKLVNTISVAGPHCRPGLSVEECKYTHRRSEPEKLYPVNTHNNIWIQDSNDVTVEGAYMEKGESGLYAYRTQGLVVNNFECQDIRGPYWRGQCVQVQESDGAELSNFYIQQHLATSSGHDNINAYESANVTVTNGLIDGNWSRNGVGVIADKDAHNMTVRAVDVTHAGAAGVSVFSGATNEDNGTVAENFHVDSVRVRDGHCTVTWYSEDDAPSSSGLAFAKHPAAQGAVYENSIYANHCRETALWHNIPNVIEQNFEVKAPPTDLNFPW